MGHIIIKKKSFLSNNLGNKFSNILNLISGFSAKTILLQITIPLSGQSQNPFSFSKNKKREN